MDKNMISIDNLVKQRLAGGEEERPAGGWLQMRELLDEKMPTSAPTGFAWRRMLGYTAALLLVSAISFGGYEMLSANRTANGGENNDLAAAANNSNNHSSNTATANNTLNNTGNTVNNNTGNASANNSVANNTGNNSSSNNTNRNSTSSNNNTNNTGNNNTNPVAVVNNSNTNNNEANHKTADKSANTPGQNNVAANGVTPNNNATANNQPDENASGNNTNVYNAGTPANNNAAPTGDINQPGNNGQQSIAGLSNAPLQTDSMDKLDVQMTPIKHTPPVYPVEYKTENVARTKVAAPSQPEVPTANNDNAKTVATTSNTVPSNKKTSNTGKSIAPAGAKSNMTASTQIIPAAATPQVAPEAATPSLATNAKKTKSNGWSMQSLDQMLQDVKYNIGRIQVFPGLIAGVNGTFFPGNTMGGFHLGVTGDFVISPEWSIFAELKYFNRFNSGTAIHDNYTTYKQITPNTYERDSTEQYFNFSTIQSLELPISVRYNINKFSIFAGGNLIYNFQVNANPLINPYATGTVEGTAPQSGKANLTTSDFGARFGLGYLFGAAYKVAPGMTVDLRLNNTFWDNAKGAGARIISSDLYRSPSMQLSFTYRLGSDEKTPTR